MSEGPDPTLPGGMERAGAPMQPGGASDAGNELPDAYRPYSTIPWDLVPGEARETVLEGVKKFHAGMTQKQERLAELEKQVPDLERQAQILNQLVQEPWLRKAWEIHQRGEEIPDSTSKPSVNVAEHLDTETAEAVKAVVGQLLDERMGPLTGQLQGLQQAQINAQTQTELGRLREEAKKKGWPSPDDKLRDIERLVASGQATSVEAAYKLAVFPELPGLLEQRVKQQTMEEMQKKAETTVPPGVGPSGTPGREQFVGKDCVARALQAAIQEQAAGRA